jgi:ankyrin repeat protein
MPLSLLQISSIAKIITRFFCAIVFLNRQLLCEDKSQLQLPWLKQSDSLSFYDDRDLLMQEMIVSMAALHGKPALLQTYVQDVNITYSRGLNLLMLAAMRCQSGAASWLLDRDININARDVAGRTALIIAAQKGCVKMVDLLLGEKIDFEAQDQNGRTALIVATKQGYVEIVELLLFEGSDIEVCDNYGYSAIHYAKKYANTNPEVYGVLAHAVSLLGKIKNDNVTLLLKKLNRAARQNKLNLLEPIEQIDIRDDDGFTPLMMMAAAGKSGLAQYCIEHGADVNAVENNGVSVLMMASLSDDITTVRLLLDRGADVNMADYNKTTALIMVAQEEYLNIAKLLLDRGADVDAANEDKETSLIVAAQEGCTPIVKLLLAKGANVNAQNFINVTALMAAAITGYVIIIMELLVAGANIDAQSADGHTALMMASDKKHELAVECLLQNKANISLRDNFGSSALDYAKNGNNNKIIKLLKNRARGDDLVLKAASGYIAEVKRLLQYDISDDAKHDAVREALAQGHFAITKLLVTNDLSDETMRHDKNNLLIIAAMEYQSEATKLLSDKSKSGSTQFPDSAIIQFLIDHGADVNIQIGKGVNLLILTALIGDVALAQKLLADGARVEYLSGNNYNALMVAIENQHASMVKLLQQYGACLKDRDIAVLRKDHNDSNFDLLQESALHCAKQSDDDEQTVCVGCNGF